MSRRVAALGVAGAVLAAALAVWVGSVPSVGPPAHAADARPEVVRLLAERAQAVRTVDAAAWLTTVEEPAIAAQLGQFEALTRIGLAAWSEHLLTLEYGRDGAWRAHVQVRYRLPGDRTDAVVDAVLDITSHYRVAGSAMAAVPPWQIAGVGTHAGRHSLVVGSRAAQLGIYAAELDRAAVSVGRMLGRPPPPVVLIIAADWEQARRMAPAGISPGLAAVTTELGHRSTDEAPMRVLTTAGLLDQLDPAARTAVFGHEAFHLATRSLGAVPRWLAEGMADYAGYRESDVPLERALSGLIRHARLNGAPPELPAEEAFDDPQTATWAYEGSQLAVRMLVAEYGVADVVALYQAVAARGAAETEAAVREILRTDLASITASWRAEVNSLAFR